MPSMYGASRPSSGTKRKAGKGMYGGLVQGSSPSDPAALEQQVEDTGASSFLDTALTPVRAVGDVLSRGNYAVAGLAEELFTKRGGGLYAGLKRAGTELGSGIGGLHGQKEGFAQVMEQSGVGKLGQTSDLPVLSWMYNDNPDSWFSKGGALDFTGRGAIGLVGDVALDPLTYVGLPGAGKLTQQGTKLAAEEGGKMAVRLEARVLAKKAFQEAERTASKFIDVPNLYARKAAYGQIYEDTLKQTAVRNVRAAAEAGTEGLLTEGGVTFLGHKVPGTPMLNVVRSGVTEKAAAILSKTASGQSALNAAREFGEGVSHLTDAALKLVSPGRDVKAFKGVMEAEQQLRSRVGYQSARWNNVLGELEGKYALSDLEKAQVVRAVDEGNYSALKSPRLQEAAQVVRKKGQEILESDISAGLEVPAVPNYIHHAYTDSPDVVERVVSLHPEAKWSVKYGDEGFLERRTFDTLSEAEQAGLHPILDPWELLRRRGTNSIKAREFRSYQTGIANLVGDEALWNPTRSFDLMMRGKRAITPQEATRIEEILKYPSRPPDPIKAKFERIAATPEVRIAQRRLKEVQDTLPMKYLEEHSPRSLDEVAPLMRKGWKVTAGGKVVERAAYPEIVAARARVADASRRVSELADQIPVASADKAELKFMGTQAVRDARSNLERMASEAGSNATDTLDYREYAKLQKARTAYDKAVSDSRKSLAADYRRRGYEITDLEDGRTIAHKVTSPGDAAFQEWHRRYQIAKDNLATIKAKAKIPEGELKATRVKEVGLREYQSYKSAERQSRNELAAAMKRAKREEAVTIRPSYAPKGEQIGRLSDEAKRAYFEERFARAGSSEEAFKVVAKYRDKFGKFFPKELNPTNLDPITGKPWKTLTIAGIGERSFPADVAAHISAMDKRLFRDENFNKMLTAFDHVTNAFKMGVTVFPAFHVRNAYNNVAQSFLKTGVGIFDPEIRRASVAMLAGHKGTFKTAFGEVDLAALREAFGQAGIIVPGESMLEYTGKNAGKARQLEGRALGAGAGAVAGGLVGGPIGAAAGAAAGGYIGKFIPKIQKGLGGAIENEGRIAHALVELKAGKTLPEAVASVNQALVDYGNLTSFERDVMRRIFPFYTWQRKNLEFQFRMLKENPGRLANEIKPFRGREDENKQMASWEAGAYKIRLDGDGKTVRMISGVDLPIRNMDLLWRGNLSKTALGVIGMMNPAIKATAETAFNKSAFTGREFGRAESATIGRLLENSPKAMQDWLGMQKKNDAAGRPDYTFDGKRFYLVFQSWMFSRIVSTSDRQFREYLEGEGGTGRAGAILDFMTGMRAKTLDMTEQQQRLWKERERAAQEALVRRGVGARFQKYFEPKKKP